MALTHDSPFRQNLFHFPIFRNDTNVFIDSVNNSIELYYWRFF
jgi:hypothetical protein